MAVVPANRRGTGAGAGGRAAARSRLAGIIGYGAHGVGFVILAAVSLWHFGGVFAVPAAVLVVLALVSLREVWAMLAGAAGAPAAGEERA